jgi:hypothetical protein
VISFLWGRFNGDSEGDSDGDLLGTLFGARFGRYWLGGEVGELVIGELPS